MESTTIWAKILPWCRPLQQNSKVIYLPKLTFCLQFSEKFLKWYLSHETTQLINVINIITEEKCIYEHTNKHSCLRILFIVIFGKTIHLLSNDTSFWRIGWLKVFILLHSVDRIAFFIINFLICTQNAPNQIESYILYAFKSFFLKIIFITEFNDFT